MGCDPIRFLPPRFPQLWKTLWKSRECREAGSRKRDFLRFFAGAKVSEARIFVFLSSQDRQERLTAAGVGGESRFSSRFFFSIVEPYRVIVMEASIWDQILTRIETKVNRHSFYTWFKPTSFVADGGSAITIRVPNTLFRDWLTKHYSVVLSEALAEVRRPDASLVFVSDGVIAAVRPGSVAQSVAGDGQLAEDVPATALAGLNVRYTFDTFIVGPSNQFAHAACRAVAEAPSRSYNPLFIYGGVGLGKTHLMHAIGHYVLHHDSALKLTYISSERFMNEMINALRYDRILDFRERYRSVDILLVDDIQFVSGKEGTQTEFFHTFNALYDAQKQIVLSSDRPPHEIPALEERLRSRFEWGLIADIQAPDIETRVAILKRKAEAELVPLPDDVAMYIAGRIKSNIRELEGSLIRLIAYASLTGREISLELTQQVLKNFIDQDEKAVTIESIQKYVSDYYQLKVLELKSRNNSKSVAMPRQIAMYLCKNLTHASLPEIGRSFGGKHHSTVIHSIKKVDDLRKKNGDFNSLINSFLQSFR
jgi:chromosomal replication initiator protein